MSQLLDERYRLERQLAGSGGATFWEGTDVMAGRAVIVKLFQLSPDPADNARFERELQLLGSLRSPHILRMFSYGRSADGHPFLVFEHVPGQTLSAFIEGGLPLPVVEHIVRQTASALWEAHQNGLVHRGISPDAIRLFQHGGDPYSAKVADFGLLRSSGRAGQLTATGIVLGTPEYMSPEQIRGERVDAATDVYSLGVVAAMLLRAPGCSLAPHELAQRVEAGEAGVLRLDAQPYMPTLRRMLAQTRTDRIRMGQLTEPSPHPSPPPVEPLVPSSSSSSATASAEVSRTSIFVAVALLIAIAAVVVIGREVSQPTESEVAVSRSGNVTALLRVDPPAVQGAGRNAG